MEKMEPMMPSCLERSVCILVCVREKEGERESERESVGYEVT